VLAKRRILEETSVEERAILAETVNYQRKSFPSDIHEAFAGLGDAARQKPSL